MIFTLPWRGRVDAPQVRRGGVITLLGACEFHIDSFTPPRRFAPTLPLQGRLKETSP